MSTTITQLAPDAKTPTQPASLRKPAIVLAALLAAAGIAWYAYDYWTAGRFLESTDDAYVGADVTTMAAKVPGLIATVAVTDNQPVHAGDLLVRLDDRDYRAALQKTKAQVAAQQATLTNLDATARLQQAIIAETSAGIAAAEAEVTRAHEDQLRFQTLAKTAAASVQAFQKADADYKQAIAAQDKARAAHDAAERQLDVIATRKDQTRAALDAAIADRDTARLNLDDTEIKAPCDGTVGNRSARAGAYAAIGAPLLAIVPANGLWVDANFKENQLARMQPGKAADITADVLPDQVFHGHVASLAPATGAQFSVLPPENATGNFTKIVQRVPVRILLDGEAATLGRLRPGLSVLAEIHLK